MTQRVCWVLEAEVFPHSHDLMAKAVLAAGHEVALWRESYATKAPDLGPFVVFHGSLGAASSVAAQAAWHPGCFGAPEDFACSSWYLAAAPWLVHEHFVQSTVYDLVHNSAQVLAPLGNPDQIFVRPDSPLKPFGGRVVTVEGLTMGHMDYGFYYEDKHLPIIAAPTRDVHQEWRYVIIERCVVAGSAYQAEGRVALPDDPGGVPWAFAQEIAENLDLPASVYVLDVGLVDGALCLMEVNPFSGADLYACDRNSIVEAVSELALHNFPDFMG